MNLIQKALFVLFVGVPALSSAATWVVDPTQAQAKFTVRHMMVSDVSGTLGRVTGTIELDEKDLTRSTVDVSIAVEPYTGDEKRDTHLKSGDFFDVSKFANATFKSKKIAKGGKDKFKVTGDLTLKDVTKEVVLDVTLTPEIVHPFNKRPARGVVATTKINRLDWNLKWQMPMANNQLLVGNDVKIEIDAEIGVKPEEKPADPAPAAAVPDAGKPAAGTPAKK